MKIKTLTQMIQEAHTKEKIIGVCATCVEKGQKPPYHWLPEHPTYEGISEVRIPVFQGYQYYSHGYCKKHDTEMRQMIDDYLSNMKRQKG